MQLCKSRDLWHCAARYRGAIACVTGWEQNSIPAILPRASCGTFLKARVQVHRAWLGQPTESGYSSALSLGSSLTQ